MILKFLEEVFLAKQVIIDKSLSDVAFPNLLDAMKR